MRSITIMAASWALRAAVDTIDQQRLPHVPLLAPSAGLVAEFLRRWYGTDFQNRLRIVAEVDSIYYGLALLRSNLIHGALIATGAAAQAAIEGRLPGGPGLRLIHLAPGFSPPLQILAGVWLSRRSGTERDQPAWR